MYDFAAELNLLLARMPYDSTYSLRGLLDCLRFLMRQYKLAEAYIPDVVELGFGFTQLKARKRWVVTIENLLYNFNVQCKFMMPSKYQ